MDKNFANWELTELLPLNPKNNSENLYPHYWYKDSLSQKKVILPFKPVKNKVLLDNEGNRIKAYFWHRYAYRNESLWNRKTWGNKYFCLRRAWSWNDIRYYLERQGYYFGRSFNTDNIEEGIVDVWIHKKGYEPYLDISFKENTYEKAREKAIIYCLNELKHG